MNDAPKYQSFYSKQPLNWNTLICVICVVFVVAYSANMPAQASHQGRQEEDLWARVQAIADHQKWQDGRHDKLEDKVDTITTHIINIDKQTAVWAESSKFIEAWIKASSQQSSHR